MLFRFTLSAVLVLAFTSSGRTAFFWGIVTHVTKETLTINNETTHQVITFKASDQLLRGDLSDPLHKEFPNKIAEVRTGDRVEIHYFKPGGKDHVCTHILIRRDCLVGIVTDLTKTSITVKDKAATLTYKVDEAAILKHLPDNILSPYKNQVRDVGKGDKVEIQFQKRGTDLFCTGIRIIREN